jgi:uncharacterized caspase-like protein
MSFHGLFIGVGKYADDDVQDLPGAGRDAIALHALFADTLGDSQTVLLVDSDATTSNVRSALESLERAVGADHTVVLYFSGHGSHDHRLAMHDTSLADLPATTISMQDIAAFFKRTAARSALFVLDCCFSGAPQQKSWRVVPYRATQLIRSKVSSARVESC